MTKKHFVAIAKVLRENRRREKIIEELCNYFSTVNANFDRGRFLQACKIGLPVRGCGN